MQDLCEREVRGPFVCGPCFHSKQAWSVHAFKVHGRIRAVRALADTLHCPACVKVYSSNIRLCRHLEYSKACRDTLRAAGRSCVLLPGVGSSGAFLGGDFLGTVLQGFGPHNQRTSHVETNEEACAAPRVWQRLQDLLSTGDEGDFGTLLEQYRLAFSAECLDCVELRAVAERWLQFVRCGISETLSIRAAAMHTKVATWVGEHVSAEWLCQHPVVGEAHLATFRQSVACLTMLVRLPCRTVSFFVTKERSL